MKHYTYKLIMWLMIPGVFCLASCDKTMDDHYNAKNDAYNNGLWEEIEFNPVDTAFVNLVKRVNLQDQIINNNTVTLWIPSNEAIKAAGLYALPDDVLKRVLQFHISVSSSYINSLNDTLRVKTLLDKYIFVIRKADGVYINDSSKIIDINKPAKNGVVHLLDKVLIPKYSIFEYLEMNKAKYSRLYKYITGFNRKYADLANSVKKGYNGNGQTVYDTVFANNNILLDKIGDFYSEDNFLTTNLVSDEVFNKALQDNVFPFLTNTTETFELETFLFNRLIDSLVINNTFSGIVRYAAGVNTLNRSKIDTVWSPYKIGPFTYFIPTRFNRTVKVNADLLELVNDCSNGVVYNYKSIVIPKNWFSYPVGRAAYTYNLNNSDSLSALTPIYSAGSYSVYNLDANGVPVKLSPTNGNIIYRERKRGWQYLIVKGKGSYVEYKVNVLPMQYNLVRECNSDYGDPVQASYTLSNLEGGQIIGSTNIGSAFNNSVFLNNPADNSGLTSMPAGYGRWITPITFPSAGTARIRFTCTADAPSGNTGVNVDLIYLVPVD